MSIFTKMLKISRNFNNLVKFQEFPTFSVNEKKLISRLLDEALDCKNHVFAILYFLFLGISYFADFSKKSKNLENFMIFVKCENIKYSLWFIGVLGG